MLSSCGTLPNLSEIFLKIWYCGRSTVNMKRGCGHSWFKVLHREHLPIKILAYIRSMRIQRCHNLLLFYTQILKTILLCRRTKISLLCHNESACIHFRCIHFFGYIVNCFLRVPSQYNILCYFSVNF